MATTDTLSEKAREMQSRMAPQIDEARRDDAMAKIEVGIALLVLRRQRRRGGATCRRPVRIYL